MQSNLALHYVIVVSQKASKINFATHIDEQRRENNNIGVISEYVLYVLRFRNQADVAVYFTHRLKVSQQRENLTYLHMYSSYK